MLADTGDRHSWIEVTTDRTVGVYEKEGFRRQGRRKEPPTFKGFISSSAPNTKVLSTENG